MDLVASLVLAIAATAEAADFSTRQIADTTKANREAVIGDAGMAFWITYSTTDVSVVTDLIRHQNGKNVSMGADHIGTFTGSDKPSVQGSNIVWIASYKRFDNPSWTLAEVPEDPNSPPEIPANYAAFEEPDGRQWFVNLADSTNGFIVYTNQGVVMTNFIGGGSGIATNRSRRGPSGDVEINFWNGYGEVVRVTTDQRHDLAPSVWDGLVSWQKEKGWPFGWEIMMWETGRTWQITTNYYYDMAPMVQGRQMVWYGWDGFDFEIFLFDADQQTTVQITSNRYDDVAPVLWDGVVVWEGYPAVEADVFMWKNGQATKLSDNVEDDFNPRIWNGQVVWQSFDGDDFEIYLFDGTKTVKLTANNYDDVNPEIRDGLITWMGYEGNWDSEIYVWDGKKESRLTENEAEDRDPKTAGGRVIWTVVNEGRSEVWLAEPQ